MFPLVAVYHGATQLPGLSSEKRILHGLHTTPQNKKKKKKKKQFNM
jgi:hypothetical protein